MKTGKSIILVVLLLALGVIFYFRLSGGKPGAATDPAAPAPAPTEDVTPLVLETPPVELTAVLSAPQLEALDTSALQRLDLTGSRCYEAIEKFRAAHPDVEVIYSVLIEGGAEPLALSPDVESLTLEGSSALPSLTENAGWLPALRSLSIVPDSADSALVDAFHEAKPDCEIDYQVTLLGVAYPYDTEEITLSGLNAEKTAELKDELTKFTHLTVLNIPQAENDLSLEDAMELIGQSDVIRLDYQVELFGQAVSLDAETMEFENLNIGNEGAEELRAMLPYFRNLRYLKLDSCGIDNEVMEKLRDDHPQIEVVWRVFFGSYHCLTDTEMIWATGGSVNDNTSGPLKYCTKVKYLDLGHTLITHADFLSCMPELEVAILAITWLNDISPIANCPKLEYLELFSSRVDDLSPLAQCTHLQHLNISCQRNSNNVPIGPTDISSLYDLPELKRFYCTMSYVPEEQQKEIEERHPDCEFEFRWVDPAEGFWRFKNGLNENYLENRNERYALLCEQFGYDTYQQSGKTWSLYG